MLQPADIIFFKKTDSFISKTIGYLTKSDFTHVGLVINGLEKTGIHGIIIEADRFVNTRITQISFDENLHAIYRLPNLTKTQQNDIVSFALSMEGYKYDYLQIVGFLFSLIFKFNTGTLFNRANKLICSELIDKAFYSSGVSRKNMDNFGNVFPEELIDLYQLVLVNPFKQDTLISH